MQEILVLVQSLRTTFKYTPRQFPPALSFIQISSSSSAFVFPFIVEAGSSLNFDYQVPFGPGTLYQICMFDKNGNAGGCQGLYTVIAPTSDVSCNNASFPLGPLDVDAVVRDGPLSQYGWVDQCTDIQVTPKNGTPPYIFTVAPTLHPPWNITSDSMSSMNWTVQLSWASSFFISVVDAKGNFWAQGPLHSGGNGPTDCLSKSESDEDGVSKSTAIGAGVGGALGGLLLGAAAVFFFFRGRIRRSEKVDYMDLSHGSPTQNRLFIDPFPNTPSAASQLSGHTNTGYILEPFPGPGERVPRSPTDTHGNGHGQEGSASGRSNVYVVHHDGGRAPVTVYHADGTEVVELPPKYIGEDGTTTTGSSSGSGTGSGYEQNVTEMGVQQRPQQNRDASYGRQTDVDPGTNRTRNSSGGTLPGPEGPQFLQQQRQVGPRPRKATRNNGGGARGPS
ncbi:hypothetical protein D9758_000103 [Tetrapyrgos nigripes]|uniref:Uncharacterized protein n=1 Tax=Tetrapyrgos nigripes TaxID=182062 RepID=A0A8H5H1P8_9AGAR|nr:hypothetical protein D9758_000103 [Tetrapyrgos nigripes]